MTTKIRIIVATSTRPRSPNPYYFLASASVLKKVNGDCIYSIGLEFRKASKSDAVEGLHFSFPPKKKERVFHPKSVKELRTKY